MSTAKKPDSELQERASIWFYRARTFYQFGLIEQAEEALDNAFAYLAKLPSALPKQQAPRPVRQNLEHYFGSERLVAAEAPFRSREKKVDFRSPSFDPKGKSPPEIFTRAAAECFDQASLLYKAGRVNASRIVLDQWWRWNCIYAATLRAAFPELPEEPQHYFGGSDHHGDSPNSPNQPAPVPQQPKPGIFETALSES